MNALSRNDNAKALRQSEHKFAKRRKNRRLKLKNEQSRVPTQDDIKRVISEVKDLAEQDPGVSSYAQIQHSVATRYIPHIEDPATGPDQTSSRLSKRFIETSGDVSFSFKSTVLDDYQISRKAAYDTVELDQHYVFKQSSSSNTAKKNGAENYYPALAKHYLARLVLYSKQSQSRLLSALYDLSYGTSNAPVKFFEELLKDFESKEEFLENFKYIWLSMDDYVEGARLMKRPKLTEHTSNRRLLGKFMNM